MSVLLTFGLGAFTGYGVHNNQLVEGEVIERIDEKKAEFLQEAIEKAEQAVEIKQQLADAQYIKVPLPNGELITVPSGHRVDIEMRGPERTAGRGKFKKVASGDSHGGFKWNAGPTDITSVGAPNLDMTEDKEGGSGGAFSSSISAVAKGARNGTNVLLFVGIALVIAGLAVIVFLKAIKTGLIVAGAGGAFIGVALLIQTYPWILLVGAIAVLGLIGYFLYAAWRDGRLDFTLKKITKGIDDSEPEAKAKVKEQIKKQATTPKEDKVLRSTVANIKNKIK